MMVGVWGIRGTCRLLLDMVLMAMMLFTAHCVDPWLLASRLASLPTLWSGFAMLAMAGWLAY